MKSIKTLISDNPFLKILIIISIFTSIIAFVPVAGFIFLIFFPQLIFFYSIILGKAKTAVALLIPVLLIVLVAQGVPLNTPYLLILLMGIVGLAVAALAAHQASIEKTVIFPAFIIIGAICAYFIYAGFALSMNPWHLVQQFIAQTIEHNINLYDQLPLNREDINFIKENKNMLISIFNSIFPSLLIAASTFLVWINVLMGKDILNRAAITFPKFAELSRWKAPPFIIWIFICSGGLLFFPNEQIRFFSLNILIITCFIYLMQGFAIIGFLFQSKKVPIFFRYLFYFLIAVQQFLMIPIAVAGLFDIWVDFRRFFQKNQTAA